MTNYAAELFSNEPRRNTALSELRQYLNETFLNAEEFTNFIAQKFIAESNNDPEIISFLSASTFSERMSVFFDSFAPPNLNAQGISVANDPENGCSQPLDVMGGQGPWYVESILSGTAGYISDLAGKKPYLPEGPLTPSPVTGHYSPTLDSDQLRYKTMSGLSKLVGRVAFGFGAVVSAWEIKRDIQSGDVEEAARDVSTVAGSILFGMGVAALFGTGLLPAILAAGATLALGEPVTCPP